jgi:TolB-like protein/tetratricopeptide (TPR) repeat protein
MLCTAKWTEHLMGFIAELKRRNVFRVGVAYLFLGWVVIQVTDTVAPALNLPDWTLALVTWIGIIGFPFALFFAWAFELTTEGVKLEKDVDRSQSVTHTTGRKLDFAIIGFLVVAVGYFAYDKFAFSVDSEADTVEETRQALIENTTAESTDTGTTEKSIAVLPFANMSGDPEQEYFGDGIAEEILNGLAQVPGLRVVARTSAFSFKGQNIDIRHIGETLNANHVLEGSVRKAGDRLRITAQLISVKDGYHLWSETYDRKTDDIFAIQEEIARAVIDELEVTLGLTDDISLVRQGTTNTEAYNWFLRGSFYIERQTSDAFDKAVESYTKAIELDPEFAGGYGGLAYGLAYGSSIFGSYLQVLERVQKAYRRALQIDENQVDALLAKTVDEALGNYNFVTAEKAVRRALAVSGNKTLVTDAYWWVVLSPQRRFDEALELLAIAEIADPLSPLVKQGLGFNLAWRGDHEASLPYFMATIEINPNDPFATWMLSHVYVELGRLEEAKSAIERLEELSDVLSLEAWATLHIAREQEVEAEQALEQMVSLYNAGNRDPFLAPTIGLVYTRLGLIEKAIDWYERGEEFPGPSNYFAVYFFYNNAALWDHPRFQALMEKMNLDDASVASAKAAVTSQ